jgi:rod shape-determining protein MreC
MERGERAERARRRLALCLAAGSVILLLIPASLSEKAKLGTLNLLRPLQEVARHVRGWFTVRETDPALDRDLQFATRIIAELRQEIRDLRATTAEVRALGRGEWQSDFDVLPADVVIPVDSSRWRASMLIARGSADGIVRGSLVVHFQHVIGRVVEVSVLTSRVVLSTDPEFKLGAICIRPSDPDGRDSEVGIAEGMGQGSIRIRWISEARGLEPGDHAVTTRDPIAGVPKGLLLGRIRVVDRSSGPYAMIVVQPELRGQLLERVQVLVPKGDAR